MSTDVANCYVDQCFISDRLKLDYRLRRVDVRTAVFPTDIVTYQFLLFSIWGLIKFRVGRRFCRIDVSIATLRDVNQKQ